jgi:hypothetical protein
MKRQSLSMNISIRIFLPVFFLTLISGISFAQSTDETKSGKISVGYVFSPQYSYRTVGDQNTGFFDDRQTPIFCYSLGANIIYELNKKISFESGILLSRKGWITDLSGLTFGDMIDPRFGFIYEPERNIIVGNDFYYLDVPIKVNYIFSGQKFQPLLSGGFTTNILLAAYSNVEYNEKTERTKLYSTSTNPLGVEVNIAAGGMINFNSKFSLRIMPEFHYSLTELSKSNSADYHLFSAGLLTNFCYRF